MKKFLDNLFRIVIYILVTLTVIILGFVIFFMMKEALPAFKTISIKEFLFSQRWMPLDLVDNPGYGILNYIVATVYVSLIAMIIAGFVSVGVAIFLAFAVSQNIRNLLYAFVDLLAGIPSVIYGFVGLVVVVKAFIALGHPSGQCVLSAALVLAIMILPFLVSSICDTMVKLKEKYSDSALALGTDKWYMASFVVLPISIKSILINMVLAVSRAMGETMAVMMLMGNANLFPKLLGKSETIASLIALEMGSVSAGTPHYHALYAAGAVLMIVLIIINLVFGEIRKRILI